MDQVASDAHHELALEAAEKSIVLLKNEDHALPLETVPKRIAVIGPAADDPDAMLGNYNGIPRAIVTPLEGIRQKFGNRAEIRFALGSVYAESSMALDPGSALTPPGNENEHGVLAEYFDNDNFEGAPALSRTEPRGYFVWAMHDPAVMRAIPRPTFLGPLACGSEYPDQRRLPAWHWPAGVRYLPGRQLDAPLLERSDVDQ